MEAYEIPSTEIDKSKIKPEVFAELKSRFPDETDTTLARFYLARNGKIEDVSILLLHVDSSC